MSPTTRRTRRRRAPVPVRLAIAPSDPALFSIPLLLLALCLPNLVSASSERPPDPLTHRRRASVPPEGYYDPRNNGGSFLTVRLPHIAPSPGRALCASLSEVIINYSLICLPFLQQIPVTYPMGLGEPINAILSGNSDAAVLVDQMENGGLQNYFISIGFAGECLGQHSGSNQQANLGDGNGSCEFPSRLKFYLSLLPSRSKRKS